MHGLPLIPGLSVRDVFACFALSGALANPETPKSQASLEARVRGAYAIADLALACVPRRCGPWASRCVSRPGPRVQSVHRIMRKLFGSSSRENKRRPRLRRKTLGRLLTPKYEAILMHGSLNGNANVGTAARAMAPRDRALRRLPASFRPSLTRTKAASSCTRSAASSRVCTAKRNRSSSAGRTARGTGSGAWAPSSTSKSIIPGGFSPPATGSRHATATAAGAGANAAACSTGCPSSWIPRNGPCSWSRGKRRPTSWPPRACWRRACREGRASGGRSSCRFFAAARCGCCLTMTTPACAGVEEIGNVLGAAGCQTLRLLELPGLGPKGDIIDWLAIAGNDSGKLLELMQAAEFAGASACCPWAPRAVCRSGTRSCSTSRSCNSPKGVMEIYQRGQCSTSWHVCRGKCRRRVTCFAARA